MIYILYIAKQYILYHYKHGTPVQLLSETYKKGSNFDD